jgi:hypothetical protein
MMPSWWWSPVVEPVLWTAGGVTFLAIARVLLLDYVLDRLGPSPAQPWPSRRSTPHGGPKCSGEDAADEVAGYFSRVHLEPLNIPCTMKPDHRIHFHPRQ